MTGFTNWKTTLAGIVTGAASIFGSYAETGHFDWKSLVVGAGLSVFGWFAKDSNVTGGTKANTL